MKTKKIIINLTGEEKTCFSALDPFEMLEESTDTGDFCLGAAENTEKGDIPTGLIICSQEGAVLIIRWLYVNPTNRGEDYGEALLGTAMDLAQEAGCRYVACYTPPVYGWDYMCPFAEDYLKNHGFDKCVSLSEEGGRLYVLDLWDDGSASPVSRELSEAFTSPLSYEATERMASILLRLEEDRIAKDAALMEVSTDCDTSGIEKENPRVSLSDLTLPQLYRCIRRYISEHPTDMADEEIYSFPPTWFDPNKSSCILHNEEPKSINIIQQL